MTNTTDVSDMKMTRLRQGVNLISILNIQDQRCMTNNLFQNQKTLLFWRNTVVSDR